ncbi:MAG: glycosyltransferase, partial [Bacilli bacterium]
MKIAILIPCYNEELTVQKVVTDFKGCCPNADIYVYDNNSKDKTFDLALAAGAIVSKETMQGKGNVVRSMFRDIDADVYVLVDGDDTYPADE